MSDAGFDFRKRPTERRAPKAFEPPPWERDAFEDLQRRKAEEARAAEAAAQAVRADEPAPAEVPEPEPPASPQPPASGGELDERQVMEMMARLAAEEPDVRRLASAVALGSALVLIALGGVLIVWGMAALAGARSSGAVGSFGGTVLVMFGAGFIGAAVWLAVRALRQRGVL